MRKKEVKFKLPLILLLIRLLIISCTHNKQPVITVNMDNSDSIVNQLTVYDLKKLPEKSTLKLSEIGAIEIEYIPLETTPQNMIDHLNNIIFSKNYLLAREVSKINMYRYDGQFITKVGTVGKGPNEFIAAAAVDVNPQDESIYIADALQPKFLVYDKNGKLIRTFKSPVKGTITFKYVEDGILCYYNNHSGNIKDSFILIDSAGKIIKKFSNKYPWKRTAPGARYDNENLFYRFNNQLYKKEVYCDTVFVYSNRVFEPHLIIDAGSQRITMDVRNHIRTMSDASDVLNKYIYPFNLFESGGFIYYEMGIIVNGTYDLYAFIGSTKNKFSVFVSPFEGIINDIDGGPNIWLRTIINDSTVVAWTSALKFKEYISSGTFKTSDPKYPEKKKVLEKLAANLKETDNPVLMLVKLKK